MKRMEDNLCRLVWWCPLFSLLGRIFPRFSLLVFRPVHPSCGPLGFRFKVSRYRNHGAKARACQTPKIKTFIAPSRCCCVQMARSYQACLTSASVNTTRCLVDVLISAWSKKNLTGYQCGAVLPQFRFELWIVQRGCGPTGSPLETNTVAARST